MCGRFFLVSSRKDIEERFDVVIESEYTPTYNAAPQQDLFIISNTTQAKSATWGFSRHGKSIINARVEGAAQTTSFSDALKTRRCLVIANGFIEWKDGQPFKITYSENELVAFAGLWEKEIVDGKERIHFVILTRDAVGEMKKYHTRMPITLQPKHEKEWLTSKETQKILDYYLVPSEFKPVDKKIGNVKYNEPKLLVPMNQLSF